MARRGMSEEKAEAVAQEVADKAVDLLAEKLGDWFGKLNESRLRFALKLPIQSELTFLQTDKLGETWDDLED